MSKSPLDRFLALSAAEIERRAISATRHNDQLSAGSREFQAALAGSSPIPSELTTVPAARHLVGVSGSPIADAAAAAAAEIPWIGSPRSSDDGTRVALAPLNQVRDLGALICGLMLLAPEATYPLHEHPPNEIYLPISGQGRWRYGGSPDHEMLQDNALVYNRPGDCHGTIAGNKTLLALYILWV